LLVAIPPQVQDHRGSGTWLREAAPAVRVDAAGNLRGRVVRRAGEHERADVDVGNPAAGVPPDPQPLAGVVALEAGPGAVRLATESGGPPRTAQRIEPQVPIGK